MHNRNRTIAVEGVLALLALALMLGAAARALQPHPDPAPREQPVSLQEPQTPPAPTPQQPDAPPPDSKAEKSTIFTGTIMKHGSDFVLRDQSGTVYRLDAPSKAEPFEGKPVKVTGKLESTARLIHVESIEEITA